MTESCDHYIHESERKAGFSTCFKCDVEKALKPVPVEPRPDNQCNCYRSMTTGKFEDGHQYPCQGGEQ